MNANAGESPAPGPTPGQPILEPRGRDRRAITAHSAGFAAAAEGHLDADVPSRRAGPWPIWSIT